MSEDYLSRIGNLIRDARKHRGYTQTQLADVLGTSQSAINRIERGTRTSAWRCWPGSARRSTPRSSRSAPPARCTCGSPAVPACRARIDVKSSKNAGVALLCAALLNKGRTTLRKVARIEEVNRILEVLGSIGVKCTLAQRRQRPRARSPPSPRPGRDRRRRPPAAPAASSCSSARCCTDRTQLRAARTPAAATSAPAPSSRTCRAAAVRARGRRRPRAATTRRSTPSVAPGPPDRADRARRHRDRERSAGRRAARRHHRDPQRQPELHGAGPLLLPARKLGVRDRRHRHHHAHRHRRRAHRRRRRLRAVRGPDRGDEPARRRRSSPSPRSPSAGCRSSSSRSSSRCSRRWASTTTAPTSTSPATATPGWSTSPRTPSTLHAPIDKIHPMPFPGLNIDNLPFFAVIAADARAARR